MADKRKPIPFTDPDQYPCPLCGSDDYEFGTTYEDIASYTPKDASAMKVFVDRFKRNTRCRVCRNCGHLMFLVDER